VSTFAAEPKLVGQSIVPLNDDAFTVGIRVSKGYPLGDAMSRIRVWLDSQKIEPATFATAADANGYTLTIGFRNQGHADRFLFQFPH
jgi:hypothetical protein